MLLIYAIALTIIILIQLVAGILAFIFSDQATDIVQEQGDLFVAEYDGASSTSLALNSIMEQFECCGMGNYEDFKNDTNAAKWNQTNVPDSCCKVMEDNCGVNYFTDASNEINQNGCLTDVIEFFQSNFKLAGILAIVFVVIELLQIVFACCLRKDLEGKVA